jgi:hypothetical protein
MDDLANDPRPLHAVLAEWQVRLNDGKVYGARKAAAEALGLTGPEYAELLRADRSGSARTEKLVRRIIALTSCLCRDQPA